MNAVHALRYTVCDVCPRSPIDSEPDHVGPFHDFARSAIRGWAPTAAPEQRSVADRLESLAERVVRFLVALFALFVAGHVGAAIALSQLR